MKEGALVTALGYFSSKEFPEKLVFKPGFDYLKKADFDWKGLSNGSVTDKLNASALDILIVIDSQEDLPLLYLAAKSNAGYRIGAYNESNTACFDFMFDLGTNNTNENLVKQCLHYLKHLKQ